MKPQKGKYLIKGFLDHKEKYQLTSDIELQIDKSFDNNLRTRNSQLGIIAEVDEENVLNLSKGDIVVVHHFTFHGDIAENKGFEMQQHVIHNNELFFLIEPKRIFATYNNKELKPLGEYVFCDKIKREQGIIYIPEHLLVETNKAVVTQGIGDIQIGDILIMPDSSMYEIELDKVVYQRVFKTDIFAIIRDGELLPYRDYFIAEDLQEESKGTLDLSMVKKKTAKSKVLVVGDKNKDVRVGEIVYRGIGTGLKYEGKVLLNFDHYHFVIDDPKGEIKNIA
ncbi:MAG: hypothetical protein JWQ09_5893 [Segetibacter sp.]|nr:hypothetical protein [Segetibacter sp.]